MYTYLSNCGFNNIRWKYISENGIGNNLIMLFFVLNSLIYYPNITLSNEPLSFAIKCSSFLENLSRDFLSYNKNYAIFITYLNEENTEGCFSTLFLGHQNWFINFFLFLISFSYAWHVCSAIKAFYEWVRPFGTQPKHPLIWAFVPL